MNGRQITDLSALSMHELFRAEAENQSALLTSGLLELERGPANPAIFETLMRAAHSLKGAARIINLEPAVRLAHALEDCFVAAQARKVFVRERVMDLLLQAVDLLSELGRRSDGDLERWGAEQAEEIERLLRALKEVMTGAAASEGANPAKPSATRAIEPGVTPGPLPAAEGAAPPVPTSSGGLEPKGPRQGDVATPPAKEPAERLLRLNAENLNRLLALAGESLVESRWLRPFADSLQRLKEQQLEVVRHLERLRDGLDQMGLSERTQAYFGQVLPQLARSREFLTERLQELEVFDRRLAYLSQRLYLEVLRTRMRPFSDCSRRFPRMVRDLARALQKQVKLEVIGEQTQVDRDILERLQTPLAHLLRNAVDHGCEAPAARRSAGKPAEALLRIEARHSAGSLVVSVSDDGAGVDIEQVRHAVRERCLVNPEEAEHLSESDLLQFLFIPGFTLRQTVTEISGRGFGLDLVQNMVRNVRGTIRLTNTPGQGFCIQLQLPLTLSVVRALLVEIDGEPYAFPLGQIVRTLKLPAESIEAVEGQNHFLFENQHIGLLAAHQVLECGLRELPGQELAVVVLGGERARYGLVVDKFLGQRELVVQALDPALGHLRDISSAALMEDGNPVLVVNVDEILRSIERLAAERQIASVRAQLHA